MTSRGETVFFRASAGKHLGRASWSAGRTEKRHTMAIRIRPHSIDPVSTQMVIEYPTGLKILPVEVTFKNVAIRDVGTP